MSNQNIINSPDLNRARLMIEEVGRLLNSPSANQNILPNSDGQITGVPSTSTSGIVSGAVISLEQMRRSLQHGTLFSRGNGNLGEIRNEVTNAFAPYPSTSSSSQRLHSVRPRATRPTLRVREWSRVFFGLSSPETKVSPSSSQKLALQAVGLGPKVIKLEVPATSQQIMAAIRLEFGCFQSRDFELLKSNGGGEGRTLTRLHQTSPVPNSQELQLLGGRSIIYIRPLTDLLVRQEGTDLDGVEPTIQSDLPVSPIITHNNEIEVTTMTTEMSEVEEIINISTEAGKNAVEILLTDENLTTEHFREELHLKFQSFQPVYVQRDNFAEQILGVYKNPKFKIEEKPQIIFAGESGADVGALQKEYFWRGRLALTNGRLNGRLPFFEGENDHKIPTSDCVLLRGGIFKTIGMFMAHGCIHSDLGFVGLNTSVVDYLTTEHVDIDTPLRMSLEDIPDVEIRALISQLDQWIALKQISAEMLTAIETLARECEYFDKVDLSTAAYIRQQIIYHIVIAKRIPQLNAMKMAFEQTHLLSFLSDKEYLLCNLFPCSGALLANPDIVINKIKSVEFSLHLQYVKEFIKEECTDPHRLGELVAAWSGWPILPDDELKINILEGDGDFCFHACFQELDIPSNFNREQIFQNLHRVLNYGSAGFGSV